MADVGELRRPRPSGLALPLPEASGRVPEPVRQRRAETFYGAINKVAPSLIRVEADEATYNMHIILRFELEQAIISGDLPLADLPEAWN